jgi:hypothetical protein
MHGIRIHRPARPPSYQSVRGSQTRIPPGPRFPQAKYGTARTVAERGDSAGADAGS